MQHHALRRVGRRVGSSTIPLLAASTLTLVALLRTRPHLNGAPTSWSGDDLAFAAAWLGASACAAWLTLTTFAFGIAVMCGRRGAATRVAEWAPPFARRALQAVLVGAWVVLPTVAYATPATPLVVHVGAGGRLVAVPGSVAPVDTPVVRAPPVTTPIARPSAGTHRDREPAAPVASMPAPAPPPTEPSRGPARDRRYVVRAGDNLWRIAQAEVTRATGTARPDPATVARYWQRVTAANRATLRSGDPSLIFPGELVTLPD